MRFEVPVATPKREVKEDLLGVAVSKDSLVNMIEHYRLTGMLKFDRHIPRDAKLARVAYENGVGLVLQYRHPSFRGLRGIEVRADGLVE